jgi:hypothetical protein
LNFIVDSWVDTNVSQEHTVSIFRAEIYNNSFMIEAINTSKSSVHFYETAPCNIPEVSYLLNRLFENLKSSGWRQICIILNSIRLLDEGSIHDGFLLLANIPTTTVKFGSQISKHAKRVPQRIVIL